MAERKKFALLRDEVYSKISYHHRAKTKQKLAKKKLQSIHGGYAVTAQEYENVKAFWRPYGVTPQKYWYQLFWYGKEAHDPRYIPDDIWIRDILPYFNNLTFGRAYADKCAYDRLFPNLNRPRTIVKNSCGHYYDGNQNVITREEAIALCLKEERFIIKFATFSYGGKDVQVLERGEINEQSVRKLFEEYRINFVIQALVEQHETLSKLNESSLNTIRTMSFFFQGKVYILSSQLRIGSAGARVDNYASGGIACEVKPNGQLHENAISRSGLVAQHPNGFYFKDVVIPNYEKVIQIVQEEAAKLPQLSIIGWDFGIDQSGEPVFIELNISSGQNQRGGGPTFGDLTEKVLKEVFIDRSLKDAFY